MRTVTEIYRELELLDPVMSQDHAQKASDLIPELVASLWELHSALESLTNLREQRLEQMLGLRRSPPDDEPLGKVNLE